MKNLIFHTFYAILPIFSYINLAIIDTLGLNWAFSVVLVTCNLSKNQKKPLNFKQNSILKAKLNLKVKKLDLKVKKLDPKVKKLDLKVKKNLDFSAFWLSAIGWNFAQKKPAKPFNG